MTPFPTEPLETLRAELRRHTRDDTRTQFGDTSEFWNDYATDYFWEEAHQDARLVELETLGMAPSSRILDLAGGHGQFLFRALERGHDAWGIEPDAWKIAFAARKLAATSRPADWGSRLVSGVGERMPFADASFDVVTSYQTLEHVQDLGAVLAEMLRVTRSGGLIHLRCPDYWSTFEGHYRLPWLPKLPRPLARLYLRFHDRPRAGLDSLHYVTLSLLRRLLLDAALASHRRILVEDVNRRAFDNALRRRGLPVIRGAHAVFRGAEHIRAAFRRELQVAMLVRVEPGDWSR